jgi:hypothetical protein
LKNETFFLTNRGSFFAEIGGYLGLFLGYALISMVDFVENVWTSICKPPPKKLVGGTPIGTPMRYFEKNIFSNIFLCIIFFQIKFAGSGADYRLEDHLLKVGRTVEIIILKIRLFTMHSETCTERC